jgi:di/tricarboxylate transporter
VDAKRDAALVPAEKDPNRLAVVEAVVTTDSELIGHSAAELHLREHYGANVLAIGHRGRRTTVRLRRVKFQLGEAVKSTGTAELLAGLISGFAAHLPDYGMLVVILVVTMVVTPILHHAAAVLVMGPIAAELAHNLGYKVDPFLMAVALGAGSDFLSPIGHQSNTLVMGPGGYHFADYWKLGLPLSPIVVGIGVPSILVFCPPG